MAKLIVLRGNSGSGKSTVAKLLQEHISPHPFLIEHDTIRRKIIKEREGLDIINPELIYRMAEYAVEQHRDVIIEGIMRSDSYKPLFDRLIKLFSESYIYYFDIPFEETIVRHQSKQGVDFTIEDMRQWYKKDDTLGYEDEKIIPAASSLNNTVDYIIDNMKTPNSLN